MSDEKKQLAELVSRVEDAIASGDARNRILALFDTLLEGICRDVGDAARESLLLYRGAVSENRDIEWARTMAAIWVADPDTEIPRNPTELQAVILGWQKARERELAVRKQQDGYQQGWKDAMLKGASFGWGGASAGKSREEVLSAAENIKP
jgi:hypothetical protein